MKKNKIGIKNNRYKPLYKQLIRLRENTQGRKKILKFKKQKWSRFVQQYEKKLKRYKRFKPYDQTRYIVSKFSTKGTSYKKKFRDSLICSKKLRTYYGGVSRGLIKKNTKYVTKNNKKNITNPFIQFLKILETRLDVILYKSKFAISVRNAKQLILHGKIFLNKNKITTPSYKVKSGDLIQIDPGYCYLIEKNVKKIDTWPMPPKYLTINYKTMEILVGDTKHTNLSTNFPFHFNLEQILVNYFRN